MNYDAWKTTPPEDIYCSECGKKLTHGKFFYLYSTNANYCEDCLDQCKDYNASDVTFYCHGTDEAIEPCDDYYNIGGNIYSIDYIEGQLEEV